MSHTLTLILHTSTWFTFSITSLSSPSFRWLRSAFRRSSTFDVLRIRFSFGLLYAYSYFLFKSPFSHTVALRLIYTSIWLTSNLRQLSFNFALTSPALQPHRWHFLRFSPMLLPGAPPVPYPGNILVPRQPATFFIDTHDTNTPGNQSILLLSSVPKARYEPLGIGSQTQSSARQLMSKFSPHPLASSKSKCPDPPSLKARGKAPREKMLAWCNPSTLKPIALWHRLFRWPFDLRRCLSASCFPRSTPFFSLSAPYSWR